MLVLIIVFMATYSRSATTLHVAEKSPESSEGPPSGALEAVASEVKRTAADSLPDVILQEPATPSEIDTSRVKGRFILLDGSPVPDVPLRMTGEKHGQLATLDWADKSTTSDAQGRFTITFTPPEGKQFDLHTESPRYVNVHWKWSKFDRRRTEDLGDIVLQPGGTIVGRVVDESGEPLRGQQWTIKAEQPWVDFDSSRQEPRLQVLSDPATGAFEIVDIPPGETQLVADLNGANRFTSDPLIVRANEAVSIDMKCPLAGIRSRISVKVWCPPHRPPPYRPIGKSLLKEVVLTDLGGRTSVAAPDVGGSCFVIDGLSPGRYTVAIDDPRYLPWRQSDVEPGSVVQAKLKGSAGVRMSVVDDEHDQPITRYSVLAVTDDDPEWGSTSVTVFEAGVDATETNLVDGLLPIFQTLIVRAEGFADQVAGDFALQPNEVVPVRVVMSKGSTLSGKVIREDGITPVGEVQVLMVKKPRPIRRQPSLLADHHATGSRSVRADETSGEFSFDRLPPGTYLLQASVSVAVHGPMREIEIEPAANAHMDLSLPALATLKGRVIAPPGASFDALDLNLLPRDAPWSDVMFSSQEWQKQLSVAIDDDGAYRTGPLPAGKITVSLHTANVLLPNGFDGSSMRSAPMVELGTFDLLPGVNERDFRPDVAFPGTVQVSVRVDGKPAVGCVVEMWTVEEKYVQPAAGKRIESEQPLRLGPVPPGDYPLVVRAVDTSWYWVATDTVRIRSGEEVSIHCEVELVAGKLRVRFQDTTQALVQGSVIIRAASFPGPRIYFPLDANGDAHLLLAPGEYTLGYSDDGRFWRKGIAVPFAWPLSSSRSPEFEIPVGEQVVPQSGRNAR